MGYRHIPLSQRRGLAGVGPDAWQVDLPEAECFMYFVAHLHQLFGRGHTLYVEGRELAPDVLQLYQAHPSEAREGVLPVFRNPATSRLHVALGSGLSRAMNRLAACRTYAQMGEAMLVYAGGKVANFERVEWIVQPDPATASASSLRENRIALRLSSDQRPNGQCAGFSDGPIQYAGRDGSLSPSSITHPVSSIMAASVMRFDEYRAPTQSRAF